ncbi:MAG: ABC transporter permease subunit [Hamadaea sp.]|uniref:ABC transporter permease subunit n=1 Tax=Hamadaea sp. TaxID=2024425 RepID=UPI0017F8F6D9|nr:ABC transporter permease subunit [Hamadaea sp.]NUR71014.1 ABC transporter permease subunit [Hamadaea sp.]NUT23695.1 ABC transporter permease subunit [Hamadaea sp.]
MIWLSWRQFRTSALAGLIALLAAVVPLLLLGIRLKQSRRSYLASCADAVRCADALRQYAAEHQNMLLFIDAGVLLVPALIGMFWGAPLIAREFETGTHRLVWSQSIGRRRWFTIKMLVVAAAVVLAVSVLTGMLTWAAGPVDTAAGDRFTTIVFGARDVVPIAYAVFGFVTGAVLGLVMRRTVPAMALTGLLVIVTQFVVANGVRPHLLPPSHETRAMTASAINELRGLGGLTNRPSVRGLTVPDAWVTSASDLRTRDGRTLDPAVFGACIAPPAPGSSGSGSSGSGGTFGAAADCLGARDLHVDVAYQPNRRYWPFQLIESGLLIGLAMLVGGFGWWRIRRR